MDMECNSREIFKKQIERLQRRIDELENENRLLKNSVQIKNEEHHGDIDQTSYQQLLATEQQLRASNQQLMATEQQLRASNQQLMATEQQLRASNQLLQASNQQLKATSDMLRQNEELYRATFEQAAVGIARVGSGGKWLEVNQKLCNIVGYSRDELRMTNFQDITHPDDLNNDLSFFNQMRADKIQTYSMEKRYFRKDGSIVWVNLTVGAVRKFDRSIKYLISVIKDITERKQAETALRDNEEQFRHFFEHLTIGVAVYEAVGDGKDFLFINMNPAGQKLSKVSIDEIRGERLTKIFPGVRDLGLFAALQNTWRNGQPAHIPFKQYQDENITQWVENRIFRLPSEKVVAIYDDRTEIMRLEERLSQAQKMESIGKLAGGVAHDFNNMLGVILGHAEFALEKTQEHHDLYHNLKEIQTAAQRSADLTRQLLTFARKEIISPRQLDLNNTLESMLVMLRRLIGEDIDLIWNPAAHTCPVKMDPSQIDQILTNLCVNARDAISGVGKLTIETGRQTFDAEYGREHPGFVPGDFVLLAVSDNGCGMDKDTMKNLFEPFYTTKEVGKGTGLGLATVYGIVKQNNGFINVYSEPGQGTTFRIYLPRYLSTTQTLDKKTSDKINLDGTETILLVEDEPSILKMTCMMLERMGYKVFTASTPGKAIDLAREHDGEIHLLMTDVVMPEMNGRDLARNMLSLYPNLKQLFMSGYTANVIAHHGVLDKAVQFIQKPFSKQDLAIKVREALDEDNL